MDDLYRLGEVRHEQCRYGMLAPGWLMGGRGSGDAQPSLVPVCTLPPPDPAPPWVGRCWAGAIEYQRDCAVCKVFNPLTVDLL